jgi:hypothetical protein
MLLTTSLDTLSTLKKIQLEFSQHSSFKFFNIIIYVINIIFLLCLDPIVLDIVLKSNSIDCPGTQLTLG